jgi:hypothetical protein
MKIIIFEEHEIYFFNLLAMQCTILLYEKIFDCEPCMPTGFEHKHQFEPIRHYVIRHKIITTLSKLVWSYYKLHNAYIISTITVGIFEQQDHTHLPNIYPLPLQRGS